MTMRLPFFSSTTSYPFDGVIEHIEKINQCAWAFQQAVECYLSSKCETFGVYREEFAKLRSEAAAIKQRIREKLPKDLMMPASRFQVLLYINEQDKILTALSSTLRWVAYRVTPGIPEEVTKEVYLLIDAVIEPIDDLAQAVTATGNFFRKPTNRQIKTIDKLVNELQQKSLEADRAEDLLQLKLFGLNLDPATLYHAIRFADRAGRVAEYAKRTGDIIKILVIR